jgi:hypothetical protein
MTSDSSFRYEHVLSIMKDPKEAPPQGDMSATEMEVHVQCHDDVLRNQAGKREVTTSSSNIFLRYPVSSGTRLVPSASTVSLTANLRTDSTTTDVDRSGVVDIIKDHLAKQNGFALWKFLSEYQRMNTGTAVGVSSMTTTEVERRADINRKYRCGRLENEPSRRTEQSTNTSDPEQHKAARTIQRLHHRFASSCIPLESV